MPKCINCIHCKNLRPITDYDREEFPVSVDYKFKNTCIYLVSNSRGWWISDAHIDCSDYEKGTPKGLEWAFLEHMGGV